MKSEKNAEKKNDDEGISKRWIQRPTQGGSHWFFKLNSHGELTNLEQFEY